MDLVDEEIFDPEQMDQVVAVTWWLVYLLGGKVVIPVDKDFWDNNFPNNTKLVMRQEGNDLVLVAEQTDL